MDMDEYYKQLEGYTVEQAFLGADDGYGGKFPTLVLARAGYPSIKIEVSRDEEGNGPGFLFIGDLKTAEEAKKSA